MRRDHSTWGSHDHLGLLSACGFTAGKETARGFHCHLVEMHAGNYGGDRPTKELCQKIGVDYDTEGSIIDQYLYRAELVTWSSFEWISLTAKGILEAEQIVEERYAQEEFRVLRKIYELSKQNTAQPVFLQQLESELKMGWKEATGFCKGLNEQKLIDWPEGVDAYLYITRKGIEAINAPGKTQQSGGDTYNLSVGTSHGPILQGPGGTQNINITITNNPEFDQAIGGLLQLIEASQLPNDDIEELKDEVIKLNRLALS